jgi:peptidyl-tRNA hydrolase, PTH1 family
LFFEEEDFSLKCIVGLGNPGNRYRFTRHNIGFLAVEFIIEKFHAVSSGGNELFEAFSATIGGQDIMIVMPQTYMNNSGFAVREIYQNYRISYDELLIVFDDFQLPFGTLRMRAKGTDGGHNGMASIIYQLQSDMIPRLRIGVLGKTIPEKHTHELMADYVLTRFDVDEEKLLPQLLQYSVDSCQSWIDNGIAKTMSTHNRNFFSSEISE